jgi:serine/threonine protein kinase
VLSGGGHDCNVDIWSLGITFYYLLTGQFPWKDAKNIWQLAEIVRTQEIDFDVLPSL